MARDYFIQTERIGFSNWATADIELAKTLWGNPKVTRYISASKTFCEQDIRQRLNQEIANGEALQIEYWPLFEIAAGTFIGCCGLRPHKTDEYEIGFHLRPEFWGKGYALEAASAVIAYAFSVLNAKKLFAGHHPDNLASRKLLHKLGFVYIGEEFYAPTGLYHPSYELTSGHQP